MENHKLFHYQPTTPPIGWVSNAFLEFFYDILTKFENYNFQLYSQVYDLVGGKEILLMKL
jgi:hypothetical protein